ncbi:choline dehydrogenase [Massarina eburnea CBS 473.64]|uniref:Choline dehydrogenase n=1 Tax=Massarina eburnea CBS 473.64 TaxID=1395130 RepID=A0A6A6RHX6_9PLEO|nr:choline dehydrogenase [Massarina eburnea CBS 473.64]
MAPSLKLFVLGALSVFSSSAAAADNETLFSQVKEKTYDYVIVGGGLTGLVVANRLTEDARVSVLVVENGVVDNTAWVNTPYYANINAKNYYSIVSGPEPYMNNKTWSVFVGNVVGGGSAVNGMQWDRGTDLDYDSWELLGNPGWGSRGLAKYFKKSTHFDAPSEETTKKFNITYDKNAYGDGPLKVSISNYQYDDYKDIYQSFLSRKDLPHVQEGFSRPIGTFWTPNSVDNSTKERSYARTAYYEPVKTRSNLKLLTNTHVDEILFKSGRQLVANGVKLTSNADGTQSSVYAAKEVILAAGGVFTPHLLMLSGIGPKDVLSKANITVKRELPGVGANFQDHQALYMVYKLNNQSIPNPDMMSATNQTFNLTSAAEYDATKTGPYTFGRGNAAAFLSFKSFSKKYRQITSLILKQDATQYLPEIYSQNKAILRGYLAQRALLFNHYLSDDGTVGEYPIQPWGRATTAVQKPLSRGTLVLNATHPAANPIIVRHAFQNPVDKMVLGELVRWNREHWTTSPYLTRYAPVETAPGANYTTDEDIFQAGISTSTLNPTYAHNSGAAALMPEVLGGVVDPQLKVYGVQGLRIVDASILPIIPAAHLQATMYAVAEKAADIIKG